MALNAKLGKSLVVQYKPALQETGGSFCRSFNSLAIRLEAITPCGAGFYAKTKKKKFKYENIIKYIYIYISKQKRKRQEN